MIVRTSVLIICLFATTLSYRNITTEILIGNQARSRAEVYALSFLCGEKTCVPDPLDNSKLLWSSLNVSYLSEVKRVRYRGKDAVLVSNRNGAVVISYPSNDLLFTEEICGVGIGTHSAEVLPDGSVVVVGTYEIFFLKRTKLQCQLTNETAHFSVLFGHGITYDRKREKLYVLGYLRLEVFDLSGSIPTRETGVSLENFYYSLDHNENVNNADGGHDLYPLEGYEDTLFLTTGERVYVYNVSSGSISYHLLYYYLPSQNGVKSNLEVRLKGGVKSISRDRRFQLNIFHAAPWFKELYNETSSNDYNYEASSNHLIWSFEGGSCKAPDYDFTTHCKVQFLDSDVKFYKARLFIAPEFNYDPT